MKRCKHFFTGMMAVALLCTLPACHVVKMQYELKKQNVPVRFYGRVIDQDSNGLARVKIKVSVRHWGMTLSTLSTTMHLGTETDIDGRFFIHGATGDAFDVDSIQKDAYELEPNTQRSYGAVGGSLTNPVIFKMWRTNIHEQLITGQKSFHIVPDGRPYMIDLAKGTIAEQGAGDLKLWIKRPEQVAPGQKYDWSSEVDVINGGLLEETNVTSSMYLAPQAGYAPNFQCEQQIIGRQSASTGTRRFYVKLDNGHEYGRITIELIAPYNDRVPGMVHLDYAINPFGSPILR